MKKQKCERCTSANDVATIMYPQPYGTLDVCADCRVRIYLELKK